MSSMMVVAWVATIGLRWFAAGFGLTQRSPRATPSAPRCGSGKASTRVYDQPCISANYGRSREVPIA
jgi:hypothetical protein